MYTGKNYFDDLKKIKNVNVHYIDFNNLPFKHKDAPKIIKQDLLRLYVLNKFGGVWSSFDIIYTNSIEKYCATNITGDKKMLIYRYIVPQVDSYVIPIAFYGKKT